MKAEMRNRIREYIIHTERRNAGICIYNKTKICPWKDKNPDIEQVRYRYKCQDEKNYLQYYLGIDETLERNPQLREILGTGLEDTGSDIIAEKAKQAREKTTQIPTESLIEIITEDNS